MRTGLGIDIHRFATGRKLILGGVEIPHYAGLDGHSDADVLLHSICDALLGAAGLKDIGNHFPNTSDEYKDISSLKLLDRTNKMIREKGYKIINIDSTLLLEEPKISQYIDEMKDNIKDILKIKKNKISIKATTSEGLGFVGDKKGCTSYTICTIK